MLRPSNTAGFNPKTRNPCKRIPRLATCTSVKGEKAEELAPKDPQVLNAIAVLESQNGQPQQAISTLNKQLALDPNNALAMNNLAFNLADTGTDLDRALRLAQQVARKFPNDPGVIDTLGWVYVKRGLNSSALQVLGGLVKKHPNEPASAIISRSRSYRQASE